jgi:hypothetical protein
LDLKVIKVSKVGKVLLEQTEPTALRVIKEIKVGKV